MSEPLTPADCDLRGLPFMPLDVMRLRDSDLALLSSGDEFKAAVLLWCASWSQVPAASLPDEERVLIRFSGLDAKSWKRAKDGAMRGWVRCSDGRLYHPVVAEKALEAWDRRGEWEEKQENKTTRQQRWRERVKALSAQLREANIEAPAGATLAKLEELASQIGDARGDGHVDSQASTSASRGDAREMPLTGTGTGTGTVDTDPEGSGDEGRLPAPDDPLGEMRTLPVAKGCWRLAVHVLVDRGKITEAQARAYVGKLKAQGLTDEELWRIAEAAWNAGTLDPRPYLAKAAEQAIAHRAGGAIDAPPERQQRAWMEDWQARGANGWRVHERGPRPGEPGCRVSAEILEEFGVGRAAA